MSKNGIKLNKGDSAIIIRHLDQGFDVEIYHSHDRNLLTEGRHYVLCSTNKRYGSYCYNRYRPSIRRWKTKYR